MCQILLRTLMKRQRRTRRKKIAKGVRPRAVKAQACGAPGVSPARRYTRSLAHGYEITTAEATSMASALGRGNRMIADGLQRVRARLEALRKRDLAPVDRLERHVARHPVMKRRPA